MNMIIITMVAQQTINTYKSSIESIIHALQEVYLNKSLSNIVLSILEIKHLTFAYPVPEQLLATTPKSQKPCLTR